MMSFDLPLPSPRAGESHDPVRRPRTRSLDWVRLMRTAEWMSLLLVGFAFCVSVASAQPDPVRNFCRRFGHQTAVIDRKLYVDGGLLNYDPISQYPGNYSNTGLLYHDLDSIAAGGMPQLFANLTKNSSVPSVNGGTLWVDDVNKRFYLFGGEHHQQPPSPYFTLWSFDTLNNEWVSFGTPVPGVNSVSFGAGVSISERGEGYYYGGWMSNNSIPNWSGPRAATSNLIKYSMDSNSWDNKTGPDAIRRAEGAMVFLPIGDGGMLVYFGGVQDKYSNGSVVGQPMEEIYLYDVLNGNWYTQPATGAVPPMRARFCAGATWAPDQSSYNIYLYGGAGLPPDTAGFDDVYILSIPSFQWIKLYPADGNETGENPHHSLSCNVIDRAQMIIIGGTFPLTDKCDVPPQFGAHNIDMGLQNTDKAPWKLFQPNLSDYVVPGPIISAVGGSGGGGATKTAPASGFSHTDLTTLMTRKATIAVRTPTRFIPSPTHDPGQSSGGKSLSTGAIAGIAVGSAVAVVVALIACIWLFRRHRRRRRLAAAPAGNNKLQPNSHNTNNSSAGPWSPHSTNTTSFTPNSPHPSSPFLQVRSPVELEAPPGSNVWRSADGITYELVTNTGGHTAGGGHPGLAVDTGHDTYPSGSGVGHGHGYGHGHGGSGSGSGELQTKIDSEGRVWIQVPLPLYHGGGSPGGQPRHLTPSQYSPTTPEGPPPISMPMIPVEAPSEPPWPQELPSAGEFRDDSKAGEADEVGGAGTPRHQTYYHP